MRYFDPHIHCYSRTTDDYEAMYLAGVRAVVEPSFWLGQPRTSAGTFRDYFLSILEFERARAADFGITHRCTIGLNPKESNDEALAEEVLAMLPEFIDRHGVVAIGELGFDEITAAEEKAFRAQVEMAVQRDLPILVHTPHRDKARGAILLMDILEEMGVDPGTVIIDHSTEETTKSILDRGFWAGHTVYPQTKLTPERFANIYQEFGIERMLLNSSADWGKADPLLVVKTVALLEHRGADRATLQRLVWDNPIQFFGAERLDLPEKGEAFDPVAANATHSSLRKDFAQ
ncbi:MAG: TatD family hydrolase [Planctomycetota bacterium]|jgi:predicted metal-dependent TIM-barrel fold hydrolase